MSEALDPGDLVVVPSAPARGVGRLERVLDDDQGARWARVFFYDDGTWGVFPLADVSRCPPGVWDRGAAS